MSVVAVAAHPNMRPSPLQKWPGSGALQAVCPSNLPFDVKLSACLSKKSALLTQDLHSLEGAQAAARIRSCSGGAESAYLEELPLTHTCIESMTSMLSASSWTCRAP